MTSDTRQRFSQSPVPGKSSRRALPTCDRRLNSMDINQPIALELYRFGSRTRLHGIRSGTHSDLEKLGNSVFELLIAANRAQPDALHEFVRYFQSGLHVAHIPIFTANRRRR